MTPELKLAVWQKATPIDGYNPNLIRLDDYDHPIAYKEYGRLSPLGWEVDHKWSKSSVFLTSLRGFPPI